MRPLPWRWGAGPPVIWRRGATLARVRVLTSQSSPLQVGWVPLPSGLTGALGLTIAPGKCGPSSDGRTIWQRDLDADLLRLRDLYGVRLLVSCTEDGESLAHGFAELPARAAAIGLEVLRLPIRDGGLPSSGWALAAALARARRVMESGPVVVHCLGGLGRSGLVAGCLLVDLGLPIGAALEALVLARGPRCPETLAQADYIRRWAAGRRPS